MWIDTGRQKYPNKKITNFLRPEKLIFSFGELNFSKNKPALPGGLVGNTLHCIKK
jgi:hypothetical protein